MTVAAPPLMKSLPVPKLSTPVSAAASRIHYPIFSLPSKATKFSPFSISSSWVCLKQRISPLPITAPFVAQTSDWAQQEEGGEEEVAVAESSEDGGFESGGEEYYPEPPEEAKLFVGNLPYDVDSEKLAQLFNQSGIVEISEVIYNRETDQSRGFGFVTMSTVEEAEKAVEMFHQYDINGRLLTVNKAAPRGSQPVQPRETESSSLRIYVGNLPWQVDDARLEQVFSEHGKVVSARVLSDRETGRSRGFGFVTMSNEAEVNDAITALDGKNLDGRALRVNVAENRQRRGSF